MQTINDLAHLLDPVKLDCFGESLLVEGNARIQGLWGESSVES